MSSSTSVCSPHPSPNTNHGPELKLAAPTYVHKPWAVHLNLTSLSNREPTHPEHFQELDTCMQTNGLYMVSGHGVWVAGLCAYSGPWYFYHIVHISLLLQSWSGLHHPSCSHMPQARPECTGLCQAMLSDHRRLDSTWGSRPTPHWAFQASASATPVGMQATGG